MTDLQLWIARDGNGEVFTYRENPWWEPEFRQWLGLSSSIVSGGESWSQERLKNGTKARLVIDPATAVSATIASSVDTEPTACATSANTTES